MRILVFLQGIICDLSRFSFLQVVGSTACYQEEEDHNDINQKPSDEKRHTPGKPTPTFLYFILESVRLSKSFWKRW
jgi:hypothetical protein